MKLIELTVEQQHVCGAKYYYKAESIPDEFPLYDNCHKLVEYIYNHDSELQKTFPNYDLKYFHLNIVDFDNYKLLNFKPIPVPEIGKVYQFYDDGKVRESRQYDAKVLNVITKEESNNTLVKWYDPEFCVTSAKELYDVWQWEVHECDWLFAEDTDYLIECDIPNYDENHIWFARTIEGGWFSMNIQNCWQGGVLDVTNELTESLTY